MEQCPWVQPTIRIGGWMHCLLKPGHKGSHRDDWNHRYLKLKGARWQLNTHTHDEFKIICLPGGQFVGRI